MYCHCPGPQGEAAPTSPFFTQQKVSFFCVHVTACVYQEYCLWTCRQANYKSMPPKKNKNRKEGCRGGSQYTPPATILHKCTIHTYTSTHTTPPFVWQGGDKASCTQCQPLWSQASPTGPSGSYSGVGRCGWLVPLCNSSSVSDTVQVCPLWPRLPGDYVNSPVNLRKYPVGIFAKPASATGLVFHLGSICC